jgi:hypothetical protein
MGQVLEKEWEIYEQQRTRLLAAHEGKFVVIHDNEVLGVYESRSEAHRAGYQRFGRVPFLVHEIVATERPRRIISHTVRG